MTTDRPALDAPTTLRDDALTTLRDVARYPAFSIAEAEALQVACATQVDARWAGGEVRYVAGADTAYAGGGDGLGRTLHAVIAVLDAVTLEVVELARAVGRLEFPYVPGLLSFREVPLLLEAWRAMRTPHEEIGLVMVDGHGQVHPRGFGLACHLGLLLDVPTLGVAKTRFVGQAPAAAAARGSMAPIVLDGRELGRSVRTRDGVRPVYTSAGHRIDLDTACHWVLRTATEARVPEPTRRADHEAERLCRAAADA